MEATSGCVDNAIYECVDRLARLAKYEFPFELNSVTRGNDERMAKIETGERAAAMNASVSTQSSAATNSSTAI